MAVQFGEKKYQEKEGESDQDGYVLYCAIYNIQYIYIKKKIYIYIYKKYIYIKYIYI